MYEEDSTVDTLEGNISGQEMESLVEEKKERNLVFECLFT